MSRRRLLSSNLLGGSATSSSCVACRMRRRSLLRSGGRATRRKRLFFTLLLNDVASSSQSLLLFSCWLVGAEWSSHNLPFTAEATMTKTTQVVAPSNLDAGYQFEAQVDGKSFMGKSKGVTERNRLFSFWIRMLLLKPGVTQRYHFVKNTRYFLRYLEESSDLMRSYSPHHYQTFLHFHSHRPRRRSQGRTDL